MDKRGSLEWDQLGKWVIALAMLIVLLLIAALVTGKVDLGFIRNLRFG